MTSVPFARAEGPAVDNNALPEDRLTPRAPRIKDDHLAAVLRGEDFLLLDGAMGTQLQSLGLEAGEVPELLCLTNPAMITRVHVWSSSSVQACTYSSTYPPSFSSYQSSRYPARARARFILARVIVSPLRLNAGTPAFPVMVYRTAWVYRLSRPRSAFAAKRPEGDRPRGAPHDS